MRLQLGENRPGARNVLFNGIGNHRSMIAERVHGRGRDGVDRVATDQCLDIHRVLVGRILGAGGRPEQTLRLCAGFGQMLPAPAGEKCLIAGVCDLRVGNTGLSARPLRQLFVTELAQALVGRDIDAADKDAGNTPDLRQIAAGPIQIFEPRNVCFDHLFIDAHGEE
jgi:hypothetical protein